MYFNPMDYLTNEEKKELAKRAVEAQFLKCQSTQPLDVLLSNAAYKSVMKKVGEEMGSDAEETIKENVKELLKDPNNLKFCLFYDGSHYSSLDNTKGAALAIAEEYVRTACVRRIHDLVDRVPNSIKLDSKKFEKMVMQEAAKLVAEKLEKK
jgi:hypothetical protein